VRAVLQRVRSARVLVDGATVGAIGPGLLVLLGVASQDEVADVQYIAGKVRELRIFGDASDAQGKMNRSVAEAGGEVLMVSQFTLYADCRKGRRPSFDAAATPVVARALYEDVVRTLREAGLRVETGTFQAEMQVELVNDGPVTMLLDSARQI
jgi:D-tyrosyl-tRNA(Tyr) deacylase